MQQNKKGAVKRLLDDVQACDADTVETRATVDRLVEARQEGHLRWIATLGAGDGVHWADERLFDPAGGDGLAGAVHGAASLTAGRIIDETLGSEPLLLADREHELHLTVPAP